MSGVGEKRKEEGHIGNAVSGSGSVVEVSMYRRMTVRLSQSVGSRTLTMVGKARVRSRGRRGSDDGGASAMGRPQVAKRDK